MSDAMNARIPPGDASGSSVTLTLRDHFAIIALSKLIALRLNETSERKALEAYQIADSMLRQRARTETGR